MPFEDTPGCDVNVALRRCSVPHPRPGGRPAVYPDVVGRAGLSQPAAHWMQNIMLRRRAETDAPYLHHRQHRDAPEDRAQRFYCFSQSDAVQRIKTEPLHEIEIFRGSKS